MKAVQLVDDVAGKTLCAVRSKEIKEKKAEDQVWKNCYKLLGR
jgi:hypothetical protein